jgi:glycosyltransferase involved in cell wall biosynthesis
VPHPRSAVVLVIPAWNEPEAIGAVLDEVPTGLVDQILVVVPTDADPTAGVAKMRGAQVLVQQSPGYGAACWTGAQFAIAAGAQIIAFLDGDYADPPADLPRLVAPIQKGHADLVLGCRDLRRFPGALPRHAQFGNALVCWLLRLLVHQRFHDLPSFKAIRARSLRRLGMREMTYGWTVEMLVKAARQQLRIEQIEVEYRPRRGGKSKVAGDARASLLAAYKLLGCAFGYATGREWSGAGG